MSIGRLGVIGKGRWRDEFLRVGAHDPAFRSFDDWLSMAVDWASSRAGPGWPEAYDRGDIHAFVFRERERPGTLLAGAIAPSADGSGRRYPLVIASSVDGEPDIAKAPEALPILLEDVWETTGELVRDASERSGIDEERLFGFEGSDVLAMGDAVASYRAWLGDLTTLDLFGLVFGDDGASAATAVLRVILAAIAPYRHMERANTPLSLRLPLGAAGGAVVCFWIDFVRRACGWTSTVPSFFWSHDGISGSMMLHLGVLPKSTLAELWMPHQNRDEFCDLTRADHSVDGLPELPSELRRVALDPFALVSDLVGAASLSSGETWPDPGARIRV